jgi:hypothetical protein
MAVTTGIDRSAYEHRSKSRVFDGQAVILTAQMPDPILERPLHNAAGGEERGLGL